MGAHARFTHVTLQYLGTQRQWQDAHIAAKSFNYPNDPAPRRRFLLIVWRVNVSRPPISIDIYNLV